MNVYECRIGKNDHTLEVTADNLVDALKQGLKELEKLEEQTEVGSVIYYFQVSYVGWVNDDQTD